MPEPSIPQLPPKTPWEHTKAWFKYSETIFLARATVLSGLAITAVGAMDWSPLMTFDYTTDFKPKQLMVVGGITVVKGLLDEAARRRNSDL